MKTGGQLLKIGIENAFGSIRWASTIKRLSTFDGAPGARVENIQAIRDTFIAVKKIKSELYHQFM